MNPIWEIGMNHKVWYIWDLWYILLLFSVIHSFPSTSIIQPHCYHAFPTSLSGLAMWLVFCQWMWHRPSQLKLFFFFLRFYLLIHERYTERGRDTRKKQAPCGEPNAELDPRTSGSWPELSHWVTQMPSAEVLIVLAWFGWILAPSARRPYIPDNGCLQPGF